MPIFAGSACVNAWTESLPWSTLGLYTVQTGYVGNTLDRARW